MNHRSTVLIADNESEAREKLRLLLQLDASVEIVAETDSGAEAIAFAKRLKPDVVLIDTGLSDINGMQAAQKIKEIDPLVKIVIQSDSTDVQFFFEAIKIGARGYLLKSLHPASRHEYLRSIMVEGASLSRELGCQILKHFVADSPGSCAHASLTPTETTLMRYLGEGCKNSEIADAMHLSENAVKGLLKDILFKLRLKNRIQLVRHAYENGLFASDLSSRRKK